MIKFAQKYIDRFRASLTEFSTSADTAHLVIDAQRMFADPFFSLSAAVLNDYDKNNSMGNWHTVETAKRIARVMPCFRKAGAATYISYIDEYDEGYDRALGGPFHIKRAESDLLVMKKADSAFENTGLEDDLRKAGIRRLLISGFNASACVRATVKDAISRDLDVVLLTDCIGENNGRHAIIGGQIEQMEAAGARAMTAAKALTQLRADKFHR